MRRVAKCRRGEGGKRRPPPMSAGEVGTGERAAENGCRDGPNRGKSRAKREGMPWKERAEAEHGKRSGADDGRVDFRDRRVIDTVIDRKIGFIDAY